MVKSKEEWAWDMNFNAELGMPLTPIEDTNMDEKFNEDLIAELLAINMGLTRLFSAIAEASEDKRAFLDAQLELGLAGMSKTNLWSIPEERRAAVLENAIARFSEIIGSVKP